MTVVYPFAAFIVASVVFTVFDLLRYPVYAETDDIFLCYRISQQVPVQISLYAIAWLLTGWQAGIACIVFWWFGGTDVLYYFIGKRIGRDYNFWNERNWFWLAWTPLGIMQFLPALGRNIQEGYSFAGSWSMARMNVILTSAQVWDQMWMGTAVSVIIILSRLWH